MKFVIAVCILAVASAAPFKRELDAQWLNFKQTYGKKYTVHEEIARRLIWEQNVAKIVQHNLEYDLGKHSYTLGLNEYADMSHQEFVALMNGLKRGNGTTEPLFTFLPPSNVKLPSTVDWRNEGLVTPVKNQGQCGSCWAFSTTGSIEGQHKKKTGNLVSLSEQNLVDCSRTEGNYGCKGGEVDQAFNYIEWNNGIDTEDSYPYEAMDDICRFNRESVGATIKGYVDIPSGDEDALQEASATIGPISVTIDASSVDFQMYRGGIYDEPNCSSTELDHAVLVIGYGTEDGNDYWLVKNSWGTSWGLGGYIKMSRNKNNQCGIATQASYPIV